MKPAVVAVTLALFFVCVGCQESSSTKSRTPPDTVEGKATPPLPVDRFQHALQEQMRIEAEGRDDVDLSYAIINVNKEYERRRDTDGKDAAQVWFDEELTDKTPQQLVEKWGEKKN